MDIHTYAEKALDKNNADIKALDAELRELRARNVELLDRRDTSGSR